MTASTAGRWQNAGLAALPAALVVLWSTCFVSPKYGLPHAEPLTFVLLRLAVVAVLFTVTAVLMRARWPRTRREFVHHAVMAALLHCTYLGCIFWALDQGVSAGIAAVIVGCQPVLTAALAGPLLGELVSARQWMGLALGLAGIAMVVGNGLSVEAGTPAGFVLALIALLGITAGMLYQKRYLVAMDLCTGPAVQYTLAFLMLLPLAALLETMRIEWTFEFVAALAYITVFVSFFGMIVFFYLLRRGAASKVVSLFYLLPPVAALFGFVLFGETLGRVALAGMALALIGVALVRRG